MASRIWLTGSLWSGSSSDGRNDRLASPAHNSPFARVQTNPFTCDSAHEFFSLPIFGMNRVVMVLNGNPWGCVVGSGSGRVRLYGNGKVGFRFAGSGSASILPVFLKM